MTIKQILNKAEYFETNSPGNYSLYYGKTGLSILYFILYGKLNDKVYLEKATNLINEMADNLAMVQGATFENGLAGLGWAVEWIAQNKFITVDTDEALEDFDDILYKNLIFNNLPGISLRDGIIGQALYFYKRIVAKNQNSKRYRVLCNRECLVLLVDKINNELLNNESDFFKNAKSDLVKIDTLAEVLIFLARITPENLNTSGGKKVICSIQSFLGDNIIPGLSKNGIYDNRNLRLMYSCAFAGRILHDNNFRNYALASLSALPADFLSILAERSVAGALLASKLSKELNITFKMTPSFLAKKKTEGILDLLGLVDRYFDGCSFDWQEGWGY